MTKILNLDAMLAEREPKVVVFKGRNYTVEGVTGRTYLQFLRMQKSLERKRGSSDEESQFKLSVDMIILAIPDLESERDTLLDLPLPQLLQLVEFVSDELASEEALAAAKEKIESDVEGE